MKHYNIAFVGMGSIGKRHLNNVTRLITTRGDSYSIDLYRSSFNRELSEDVVIKIKNYYLCTDPVQNNYDIVFITNPTSKHLETYLHFHNHTKSFFIEKPVFDTFNIEESVIAKLDEIPSYVACPLRFNPVLQYVKQNVNLNEVISVRAMSSSYLPDWRPEQDYRQCYSAHANMGGGVDIDLIHEWDYLTFFFGMPKKVFSIQKQISPLEIDSNDIAIYIAMTETTTIELHLDYFGRKTLRSMDIFLSEETIHCDIANGKIEYLKEGKTVELNAERNSFQMKEIEHFFDIINGVTPNNSNVLHAYRVLKLTKGII